MSIYGLKSKILARLFYKLIQTRNYLLDKYLFRNSLFRVNTLDFFLLVWTLWKYALKYVKTYPATSVYSCLVSYYYRIWHFHINLTRVKVEMAWVNLGLGDLRPNLVWWENCLAKFDRVSRCNFARLILGSVTFGFTFSPNWP